MSPAKIHLVLNCFELYKLGDLIQYVTTLTSKVDIIASHLHDILKVRPFTTRLGIS